MASTSHYNTRLSARKLALALQNAASRFISPETASKIPGEPDQIPVNLELSPLVKHAIAAEQARETEEDDTEGQEISYSPSSSPALSRASSPEPAQKTSAPSTHQPASTSGSDLKGGHTGRRRRKRQALAQKVTDPRQYKIRSSQSVRYRETDHMKTSFDIQDLPAAKGGDIGLRRPIVPVSPALEALLNDGFKLVRWNGRDAKSLVDRNLKVFVHLAGRPTNDPTYDQTIQEVEKAIIEAGKQLRFGSKQLSDRRGPFPTFAYGISYGGGQKRPGNLKHSVHNQRVLEELHANPHVIRLMKYANSVVAFHFPLLYREYADNMAALLEHHPYLKPVLNGGIYAATSTNFGPSVVTYDHEDFGNKANGVCPIFSFGNFDPIYGGHLVLRQLKLVIEFPPGSLIIVPSATLTHGNTPIKPHERRLSFTQYAAGGLFRWVRYGFRTWARLLEEAKSQAAAESAARDTRWEAAVNVFSHVERVHEDRLAAGLLK